MPLSELERTVCDRIAARASELYANLERAVAIPTGRGFAPGLKQYREFLMDRLRRLGAEVNLAEGGPRPEWLRTPGEEAMPAGRGPQPTVIGRHGGGDSRPRVLIVGHIDTVHDPHGSFQKLCRCDDGTRAIGPGAVDMKGGIECAFAALEALRQEGVQRQWTMLLNADEETGSFESEAALRDEASKHDFGIVLEPALPGGALAIERMGSGQFKVEVFGKAAHVGRDFAQGISAVNELARVIVKLAALADPARGRIVNVGPLQGGGATNIVADYATCWGNVRFRDEAAAEELARGIDALASEPSPPGRGQGEGHLISLPPGEVGERSEPGEGGPSNGARSRPPSPPTPLPEGEGRTLPRVVVHRHWNRPAKPKTTDVERFATFVRSCAEDLGQQLPFASTGGVCDGNILQAMGLPTLDTLGIRGGNLHRPDEFIEIAALVERAQLLAVLLMRLE